MSIRFSFANGTRIGFIAAVGAAFMLFAPVAVASTVGVAVDAVGSATVVGSVVPRPVLGPSIEYFIPLGNDDGTYGVVYPGDSDPFGTTSDSGNGGGVLTMILRFDGTGTGNPGVLTVLFEDLDLIGGNDPNGFLEQVQVLDKDNGEITEVITNLGGLVTGTGDTQQLLALNVGVLNEDPIFLKMQFTASFFTNGTNTAEYLRAELSAVPLPAALPLYGLGIVILGLVGWRRRRRPVAV